MKEKDWTDFLDTAFVKGGGAMDDFLSDHGRDLGGDYYTSVRKLVKTQDEDDPSLDLPVKSGTRVYFQGPPDLVATGEFPPNGMVGTVVTVRSSRAGDITAYNNKVFVSWDDGEFRPVRPEFLREASDEDPVQSKKASESFVRRANDFFGFVVVAEDTLVQKATRDLWNFKKDGESYVIERLFEESGDPLKV